MLKGFTLYHEDIPTLAALSDRERGRLMIALLVYSSTGEEPQLGGNERFVFPAIKERIDRDKAAHEAKCAKNRENARCRKPKK